MPRIVFARQTQHLIRRTTRYISAGFLGLGVRFAGVAGAALHNY